MSGAHAIQADQVVKVYGEGEIAVRALRGVRFDADAGEFVAIMGPSGSGKSTLLHIVGALEAPTSGSVLLAGSELVGMDDSELTRLRREHIGFVFQFFNLLPSLSAVENVMLPALIARKRSDAVERRAQDLLAQVGLGDRIEHLPSELSGGEQQRVSIARALLLEPALLLADEPTGNLDSRSGGEVLRLLRSIADTEARTVVMVTHDPDAAAVADRVVFLRDGQIVDDVKGGSAQRVADAYMALDPAEALTGAV